MGQIPPPPPPPIEKQKPIQIHPQPPSPPPPPQNKSQSYQYIIHMKVLALQILTQFKNFGDNVDLFIKQLKNPSHQRGINFQGKLNNNGQIIGIAKYFNRIDNQCSMFFGQCQGTIPKGRGINIKCIMQPIKIYHHPANPSRITQQLNKQSYQAQLFDQWQQNKTNTQTGSMLKKYANQLSYFHGKFTNKLPNNGKLIIKQNKDIKLQYQGQFLDNAIHGQGILKVPDKYCYIGTFYKQNKQGIGQQHDQIRKTRFIGQFQDNKRHGYGELTYLDRENVKLIGFWTEGIMKAQEGVYVTKDGAFLQIIGEDIQLI